MADDLEFRGVYSLQYWHVKQVLETILSVTRKAKKNLYFQCDTHSLPGEGRKLRHGIEIVKN
jgi:hypothetical protein